MTTGGIELGRVLVIDDDEKLRDLLSDMLEGQYHVATTGDPVGAIDVVGDFQPDIVVLDYNMPEMNGLEVLRNIKAAAPTTQVIMVTGVAEVQLAEEAFRLGAFAYLPKPFQLPYA